MQLTRRVVVTNHGNHDIEWLKDLKSFGITRDDIYIYERSGNGVEPYQHLGKVFESPNVGNNICLLYTSPSPRDLSTSRMPSSA